MRAGIRKPCRSPVRAQAFAANAVLTLLCLAAAAAAAGSQQHNMCTAGQGVKVAVGVTSKTVLFVCQSELPNLRPPNEANASKPIKCFRDRACTSPEDCSTVLGADVGLTVAAEPAAAKAAQVDKAYTVAVEKLPKDAKTVFFQCSSQAAAASSDLSRDTGACTVEVTIPAKPAADTCAEANETITVEVDAAAKTATFNCGGDLTSLNPVDTRKVFKEDCSTEVSLEEALPSAKLTKQELKNTLALTELPKAEETLCYRCLTAAAAESSPTNECTVKVKVPSSGSSNVASRARPITLAGVFLAIIFSL